MIKKTSLDDFEDYAIREWTNIETHPIILGDSTISNHIQSSQSITFLPEMTFEESIPDPSIGINLAKNVWLSTPDFSNLEDPCPDHIFYPPFKEIFIIQPSYTLEAID